MPAAADRLQAHDLLTEAKATAARTRRPLGAVLDDALRVLFAAGQTRPEARPVTLPTDGGSGLMPGVDLEDKEHLAELLGDNEAPRAAR